MDAEKTVKTEAVDGNPAEKGTSTRDSESSRDLGSFTDMGFGDSLQTLEAGFVVADRYQIVSVLGIGGMGVVYRALDQSLGVEIALKVLRPEVAHDQEFLERFRNELLIARQVTHRNVVRLHDLGEHEGLYYMSMDLITGRSLQDILREKLQLEPGEAVRILLQISRALAEAHRQNVVHRDLKPANILLDNETGEAYISDFGIARSLNVAGLTKTGMVVGTPNYLSPEQARSEKVGAPSDIYSLGIIFVEMLSGRLPFSGGTLLEIIAQRISGHHKSLEDLGVEVDPALAAVVDRCLAGDPNDRYPSAAELVEDLEDLSRPVERKKQERRRILALRAGWVAVVVLFAALVGVAVVRFLPPKERGVDSTEIVETSLPTKARYAVAVLPFSAEGSDELEWASTGVAEMLASTLAESEGLRVIDNLRVVQTLQDLGFTPGQIREDQLSQLAEVFEANRLVTGSLRSAGESIRLETRLVEVDRPGSPTRLLEPLQGEKEKIFDLVGQLGSTLRTALEVDEEEEVTLPLTASPAAMEAYTRGLDYWVRGESLLAAPELERAVLEDPDFAAAWVRLAKTYEELGRSDEALEAARESVRASGTTSGRLGYEARAREALLRGEHETAQRFLEELVERYPNDTAAQIALAEAYGQVGRFADAVERLERAVEIDRSQPRTWYLLGRYSIQAGDPQKAVDEYLVQALIQHRTLKNEQGAAETHNALGVAYQNLGQFENAAENYGTAAEIQERLGDQRGLATSLLNLAMIELTRGASDTAEAHLVKALGIHEELGNRLGIAETYTALGILEERRGHSRESLDAYLKAHQISKDLGDEWMLARSFSNVGYSHFLLGEYDSANLFLEKALELYRKNEEPRGTLTTLQSLGFCQGAQGQWTRASRSFLEALNLAREIDEPSAMAVSHGNLGVLARNEGRFRAAFESYGEALTILERVGDVLGQVEFRLHEAEAYLEIGSYEKAASLLEQVETLQGDDANREDRAKVLRLRGRVHQLKGESGPASRLYTEALTEAQASRAVAEVLEARIAQSLGRLPRAEGSLNELRTVGEEVERLGHAMLKLRSAEALALVALEGGQFREAEETLREALRLAESREANGYAGSFRLRSLLAESLEGLGQEAAASRVRNQAEQELQRVREEIPEELREDFDAQSEVAKLRLPSPAKS